jgi:hypothetical protein
MADKKKIGYYVSRGKCVKAYKLQNPKTKKYTGKRVSESGRKLKEGTRVFKTKALCMKYIAKKQKIKAKPVKRQSKKVGKKSRMNKFGDKRKRTDEETAEETGRVPYMLPVEEQPEEGWFEWFANLFEPTIGRNPQRKRKRDKRRNVRRRDEEQWIGLPN